MHAIGSKEYSPCRARSWCIAQSARTRSQLAHLMAPAPITELASGPLQSSTRMRSESNMKNMALPPNRSPCMSKSHVFAQHPFARHMAFGTAGGTVAASVLRRSCCICACTFRRQTCRLERALTSWRELRLMGGQPPWLCRMRSSRPRSAIETATDTDLCAQPALTYACKCTVAHRTEHRRSAD